MSSPGAGTAALHRDRSSLLRRRNASGPPPSSAAHLDGDVVQAWYSASDSYVVQGPTCGGLLTYPTWTFTAADFEAEWAHRVERMRRHLAPHDGEQSTA